MTRKRNLVWIGCLPPMSGKLPPVKLSGLRAHFAALFAGWAGRLDPLPPPPKVKPVQRRRRKTRHMPKVKRRISQKSRRANRG